jgi:hypothetical protein
VEGLIEDGGEVGSVLCPDLPPSDYCDCGFDCTENPQWCACGEAQACCGVLDGAETDNSTVAETTPPTVLASSPPTVASTVVESAPPTDSPIVAPVTMEPTSSSAPLSITMTLCGLIGTLSLSMMYLVAY